MLVNNTGRSRLAFTTSTKKAVNHAEVLLIAAGTPPSEGGSADLDHILIAAASIGKFLSKNLLAIVKSTVPVGTCDCVRAEIQKQLDARDENTSFSVASNPEFLAEGRGYSCASCKRVRRRISSLLYDLFYRTFQALGNP